MTASDLPALLRRWRHDLHRIPEIGLREHRTGDYLADALGAAGLPVTRGVGGTGLVATVRRAPGSRAVALRADMDGLALTERGDRPHRSRHDGVMHACGHDGHMAMVLGAGHVLAAEGGFAGAVHLVFQPAEEPGLGARAMIDDGLFRRFPVESVFGLHNMPGHPAGRIATRPGPLMAAEDGFEIRVTGRGGHAARPQMVVDPIVVAAEIVLALQTIVARSVDPAEPAVVSCTGITTDGARNAIPGTAVIRGDARSFTPAVRSLVERRIREIADGVGAAHGATCTVTWSPAFEPTVNDPAAVALAVAAARASGADVDPDTAPWTASEDFGLFAREVPGCFALLGTGDGPDVTPLHSPDYDFADDVLETGVAYYVDLVRTALPIGGNAVNWVANPARDRRWTCPSAPPEVRRFHRGLTDYAPTRLVDLPDLARELGVGHVVAKDESDRFGLPAFKALGASWAVQRALHGADGPGPETLVCATDGNHGRAVAHFARVQGRAAHVFVPDGVHPAVVAAIRDEGAVVTHVPGPYDDAVRTAAACADDGSALLVQDTAWEGYTAVPSWIVDGYSTLFAEVDDQLGDRGLTPDLVVVPTGVGSLLQAALVHYRSEPARLGTAVLCVEPDTAACVLTSVAAGRPVTVDTGHTPMTGLNCGTVSTLAWPLIVAGLDACVTVTDADALAAARDLAALGVPAGPCGGAALAGVRAAGRGGAVERRARLGLSPEATVVLLVTESAAANPQVERR